MDSVIGPLQSSFIPKCGTCDHVIIIQEIVHHMHKKTSKTGFIMFKIDSKKPMIKLIGAS